MALTQYNFIPTANYLSTDAPMNQQQWAEKAYQLIRRDILNAAPVDVLVSYGFPKLRSTGKGSKIIGECHYTDKTGAGKTAVIFIRPSEWTSPIAVLDVLAHEMVHACTPGAGHKGKFVALCKTIGLTEGKPKSASANEQLKERLNALAYELGDFPRAAFDYENQKKQTTRLRLYQCQCDPKEAKEEQRTTKIRCASDNMDMTCNVCEQKFEMKQEEEKE